MTASGSVRIDEAETIALVTAFVPRRGAVTEDLGYLEFELYGGS